MATYSVDSSVFAACPGYQRAVLVAKGVSNGSASAALEARLRAAVAAVAADESMRDTSPKMQAWFKAYKSVGVKGEKSKVFPGVVGLLRRIAKGGGDKIPFISALVTITNVVALEHMCPTGAFDLENVSGEIRLGPASGDEMYTAIKDKKTKQSKAGDIVLQDTKAKVVVCNNWNSAGGLDTCISDSMEDVVVDIDMIIDADHTDKSELLHAAVLCADLLKQHCGATDVLAYVLSKDMPSFTIGGAEGTVQLPAAPAAGSGTPTDGASGSTQWVQQDPARTRMLPVPMAASMTKEIVALVGAAGCELGEAQTAELQESIKTRLNGVQNYAYATGCSTVLNTADEPMHMRNVSKAKAAKGSTQWVQQDPARTRMLPVPMAASMTKEIVALVGAAGYELGEAQTAELQESFKTRLNGVQNYAYATGCSTVLVAEE
eukprot:SAG22_NODE_841_length_6894_cov_3.024135_4_plen_433_part_00